MAFTHLHVHTEYSLLDGMSRISKVCARAKELGMDSLAITDHGAMFGAVDFYKECKAVGIKPIIGCEVYLAPRTRYDKDPERDKYQNHLLLLAETNEGYRNLIKIVSRGFTEGFYYKPRVDKEILRRYSGGIIATSACLAGKIQHCLVGRDYDGARREAEEMREIFGPDNFFLEIQNQLLPEEQQINPLIYQLSEELGIPVVATNDVHYINREDARAHDVLLAIQTATSIHDPKRLKFANDEFYLKSEEEMRALFPGHPEVIDNTQIIAKRCNVDFTFGQYHLPEFVPPEGKTNDQYLRELCAKGLAERYDPVTPELRERMEMELSVIESMGFVEYFLIVWDFIDFAKSQGIMVGPGRGSAAGSIVAYCLRITDIDPIKNQLIFERFLNPERVSMPDIDIDFCIERRGEVIDYVRRKYGKDNVSQIITFGTLKAKAAIRDVGRALEVSYADTDKIAKAVPNTLGMTLATALEVSPDLKKMVQEDPQVRRVIEMSQALEGLPRHASTHAAGVVISRKPLDEYVPLYMSDKGIATQFNMTTIEELGLLKMDFLGLRNLTVIRDALAFIEADTGEKIDLSKMQYDDPEVYRMISEGNTAGVFQLESEGMTSFMKSLQPSCFEDVVAGIALYRPGPMDSIPTYIKNKKDPSAVRYITPELAPILDVTYGCIIYQEQVMQIVRELAGYSYGRSDLVRRAMSKKKAKVMMEEKQYFIYGKDAEDGTQEIKGCIRNGISEQAAEQIFAEMESFAAYAFNKSHAAAYAVLAYQTGWLKLHYPKEFMAALLSSVMGDMRQVSKYIRNCEEMGIQVLPPSVNESQAKFTVASGKIRYGLMGVKNVGENVIDEIIRARETKGLPRDIFEFIGNLDVTQMNRKALESLIKAGALDCLNTNRAAHLAVYEGLLKSAQNDLRRNVAGQLSLFQLNSETMRAGDTREELPKVANFDEHTLLAFEKEMLGVYLTGHPLDEYRELFDKVITATSADLMELGEQNRDAEEQAEAESEMGFRGAADWGSAPQENRLYDGKIVTMAGIITNIRNLLTKSQKMMAFVEAEDREGPFEVIVFPNVFERCSAELREDNIIVVRGRLNIREGEDPKVLAESVTGAESVTDSINRTGSAGDPAGRDAGRPEGSGRRSGGQSPAAQEPSGEPVKVRIPPEADEKSVMTVLAHLMQTYPGNRPVLIYRQNGKLIRSGRNAGFTVSTLLEQELASLVGAENVKL